ncbi:MAG: type I-U CRISPR-associated protein Csx17 [Acidimicrobiia bacterium]
MNELVLAGCRPEPLGSYLKALGVLRIVGEQGDRDAKGCWSGEHFVLDTALSEDELVEFFLDRYEPTPIVAPWNGRGGFAQKNRPSEKLLARLEGARSPRARQFVETIRQGRSVYERATSLGWDPKRDKDKWIEACRSTYPDVGLLWLDANAVVTAEGRAVYAPLLGGSGGVLGSLDISQNYFEHLERAVDLGIPGQHVDRSASGNWLSAAFGGANVPCSVGKSPQMFHPGGAAGPNSSTSSQNGRAEPLVNPWDFILLVEGALVWASAACRRYTGGGSHADRAAFPFSVSSMAVGFASAAASKELGTEVWAPLWGQPATIREITHLVGEGRLEWHGRAATRSVDAARALATLGVERGIPQFNRLAILRREGEDYSIAIPIGRVSVRERPGVSLTARLDPWWDRVRRARNPPTAVSEAMRRCDAAVFEHARVGTPAALLDVLAATADLESRLARSPQFRDEHAHAAPVSGLAAAEWLPLLDNGSVEFRLAAALASQHDGIGRPFLRLQLRPVKALGDRGLDWVKGGAAVEGLLRRPLVDVLADALIARARARAGEAGKEDQRDAEVSPGVDTSARYRVAAPVTDVATFVRGEVDDERLATLLAALLLLDYRGGVEHRWPERVSDLGLVAPAWAILAPFFHGRPIRVGAAEPVTLRPELTWPAQLARGRVAPVVASALRRLRYARLDPAVAPRPHPEGGSGPRLAAAMLIPISSSAAAAILRRVVPAPLG